MKYIICIFAALFCLASPACADTASNCLNGVGSQKIEEALERSGASPFITKIWDKNDGFLGPSVEATLNEPAFANILIGIACGKDHEFPIKEAYVHIRSTKPRLKEFEIFSNIVSAAFLKETQNRKSELDKNIGACISESATKESRNNPDKSTVKQVLGLAIFCDIIILNGNKAFLLGAEQISNPSIDQYYKR